MRRAPGTRTQGASRWGAALIAGLCLAPGCYGQLPPPRTATLRVAAEPPTTTVYVDGDYFSSARVLAQRGKPLPVGKHLVTFMAPGYFPHDVELDLKPGETHVRMTLLPIPP